MLEIVQYNSTETQVTVIRLLQHNHYQGPCPARVPCVTCMSLVSIIDIVDSIVYPSRLLDAQSIRMHLTKHKRLIIPQPKLAPIIRQTVPIPEPLPPQPSPSPLLPLNPQRHAVDITRVAAFCFDCKGRLIPRSFILILTIPTGTTAKSPSPPPRVGHCTSFGRALPL